MSNNLNSEEFKLVKYGRKTKKINTIHQHLDDTATSTDDFNLQTTLRRIEEAKDDIVSSDYYSSVKASLSESLQFLGKPSIVEIVTLGLGRFTSCMVSRHQFSLLLALKALLNNPVITAYDPQFTPDEISVLKFYDVTVPDVNTEGKIVTKSPTLFYLPHCPKQLSNNLLWANWGLKLSNCVIIGNSLNGILEGNTKRCLIENASYVIKASPFMIEVAIINSFKYYDIFNDLAIHVFPIDKLALVSDDLWKDDAEPQYACDDVEFIRN